MPRMAADAALKEKVEELIGANPVLLFMKGTPEMPRCGFSMRVVQVLDQMDVEYGAIDVLPALQPLREVTAELSDWQTFPQLYVNGELVGGADIVEEMFDSGAAIADEVGGTAEILVEDLTKEHQVKLAGVDLQRRRLRRGRGRGCRLGLLDAERLGQLAGVEHLLDDVRPANQLTVDVELREGLPVGDLGGDFAQRL